MTRVGFVWHGEAVGGLGSLGKTLNRARENGNRFGLLEFSLGCVCVGETVMGSSCFVHRPKQVGKVVVVRAERRERWSSCQGKWQGMAGKLVRAGEGTEKSSMASGRSVTVERAAKGPARKGRGARE